MADLGEEFRTDEHEPNSFGVLPAGDYEAAIIASEKKPTQAGDGAYIKFEFQILSGEYQNRKLWANLNLWNKSSDAVRIAQGDLSAIGRAVGVHTIRDTSQLHNKAMVVSVKIKKDRDGNPQNQISGYKPRHATGANGNTTSDPQQTANAGASNKAPW